MKKLFIFSLLLACGQIQAQSIDKNNATLVVNIKNFKSDVGMAYISLQDPDQHPVQKVSSKINNKTSQVIFKNVAPGKYAVRLFHDENENKVLDKGIFGFPKESWGVSNDAKGGFGPPKYEDMIFVVDKDKTISIVMN
jgi:uncharacterized protein (DUF2141 family)